MTEKDPTHGQVSLFDAAPNPNATRIATEAAIRQVDEHADNGWRAAADWAIAYCIERHDEFTADEVWAALRRYRPEASTHEPSAMGPVFRRAAAAGLIRDSGRRRKRSVYAQRHRELTIWERA